MIPSRHLPAAVLLAVLPLAALSPVSLTAQEEEAEPAASEAGDGAFFESVDVTVVNVDVYVTDKKGNPVTGLTQDDFEILEDGRPVTITNFYAVEGGRPVAGAPADLEADPEQPPIPGRQRLPRIPEDQRLSLIVYIDNFNIRPFNRNRVFRRLREFLHDSVDGNDRVMLVTYDRSLHYRHLFTSDSGLIANALFDLEKLSGWAVHSDNEWKEIMRDIHEAGSLGEVAWRVRQFAESRYNDMSFTLSALRELVDTLAGVEGRKALLYVSDGLPMSPAEELFQALLMKFGDSTVMSMARDYHLGRNFNQLVAQANTNRVVFYTIDAGGLRVGSAASAEVAYGGTSPGLSTFVDQVYISNLQSSLRFMADETGGRAIFNTNDVGPGLAKIGQDFDSYYSLGYSPSHHGDGRYYDIKVKVRDKGLEVRHRKGYRAKNQYARMADSTTATLLYGLGRNPLDVAIHVGQENPGEKSNQFVVPVMVEIPLRKVVLVPHEEFHVGRLKLFFGAMDEKGDMSDVSEVPLDIRIPNGEMEGALVDSYRYAATLQIRRGPHRLAVGVRDEIGAVESFVIRNLQVGS